jgi:hypothetical protein
MQVVVAEHGAAASSPAYSRSGWGARFGARFALKRSAKYDEHSRNKKSTLRATMAVYGSAGQTVAAARLRRACTGNQSGRRRVQATSVTSLRPCGAPRLLFDGG